MTTTEVTMGPEAASWSTGDLTGLIKMFYDIQRYRKAAMQRMASGSLLQFAFDSLSELEGELKDAVEVSVKNHPVWDNWLVDVKGIGPLLAASLLAGCKIDIHSPAQSCPVAREAYEFENNEGKVIEVPQRFCNLVHRCSTLWSYAGLSVDEQGRAVRKRKGTRRPFHGFFNKTCHNLRDSLMRARGGYYDLYNEFKADIQRRRPERDAGWHHNHAQRRMTKLFLAHLGQVWCEACGIPYDLPYAIGILGHSDFIEPIRG